MGDYTHVWQVAASNQASDCIECVAGKYLDVTGGNHQSDCIVCRAGKHIGVPGTMAETHCVICSGGKYTASQSSGNTAVELHAVTTGAVICNDCVLGKFNLEGYDACDRYLTGLTPKLIAKTSWLTP